MPRFSEHGKCRANQTQNTNRYEIEILSATERQRQCRPTILISVHSFTPTFHGSPRPWHAGVLYNKDPRLAMTLLRSLSAEPKLVIGDNEPYGVRDETDYTIPEHGEKRGLPHVGIELRQDLIATEEGQTEWAERLTRALVAIARAAA